MSLSELMDHLAEVETADLELRYPAGTVDRRDHRHTQRLARRRLVAVGLAVTVAITMSVIAAGVVWSTHGNRPTTVITKPASELRHLTYEPGATSLLIDHTGEYSLTRSLTYPYVGLLSPVLQISPDLACTADWRLDSVTTVAVPGGYAARAELTVTAVRQAAVAYYTLGLTRPPIGMVPLGGAAALKASASCRPALAPPLPMRGVPEVSESEAIAAALSYGGGAGSPVSATAKLVSRGQLYRFDPSVAPSSASTVDTSVPDREPVWVVVIGTEALRSSLTFTVYTVDAWPRSPGQPVGAGTTIITQSSAAPAWLADLQNGR